jgi:hypothetical protein
MASAGSPEEELETAFPHLRAAGYRITGPATSAFNCIAWAAGETDGWWQADLADGYWPEGIPRDGSVQSLVALFQALGYQFCDAPQLEDGFEKVAIYAKGDAYTHAARLLEDGRWTSKLGRGLRIEHDTLDGLTGVEYGAVAQILKRPR